MIYESDFIMMKRAIFSAAISMICLNAMTLPAPADPLPANHVDRMELLDLLREQQFGALEARFGVYQAAYESAEISDRVLKYAYGSLLDTSPAMAETFAKWLAEYPKSYVARTARANFHREIGWRMRGRAYANKTARVRFRRMSESFRLAEADYVSAIRIKPQLGVAYAGLIDIMIAEGNDSRLMQLVKTGLEHNPRSYAIRYSYLHSLVPWWRGGNTERSFKAVVGALEEIESQVADERPLEPLLVFDSWLVANILKREKRYDDAHKFIDKAIEHSDDSKYLEEKANIYFKQDEFDLALKYYSLADAQWPGTTDIITWRGLMFWYQDKFQQALDEFGRALAFDPYRTKTLRFRAKLLQKIGRYEEALEDLDRAMIYGSYDAHLLSKRGQLLYTHFNDHEAALRDFEAALSLSPDRTSDWFRKGSALHALRNCESVAAYRTYLAQCETHSDCTSARMTQARNTMAQLIGNWCPDAR